VSIGTDLAATRAGLYDALYAIPDVTVYAHEPDAAEIPAVWIDQPDAVQGSPAPLFYASWDVVIVVETHTAVDVADRLDDLVGVVIDNVTRIGRMRFARWQRATTDVAGVTHPSATVSWITDYVLC
jgi:hypothetical protein